MRYALQNMTAGYVGNSPLFWRAGGNGYTHWLDDTEFFSWEEANKIAASTRGTHSWTIWPEPVLRRHAKLTVDIQDLRKEPIDDHIP